MVPYLIGMPLRTFSAGDGILATYSIILGVSIFTYETKFGLARGIHNEGSTVANPKPSYYKGLMYAFLTLPLFMSLTGILGNYLMLLPISLNFVSGYMNEIFIPPKPRRARGGGKKK